MDKALCLISGRMACDPDIRSTPSGKKMVRFAVAVKTPKSNDRELVSFFECIAWGDQAERCKRYRKGEAVEALGNFYIEKYTDRNGNQRTMTMINVKEMFWTSGTNEQNDAARARSARKAADVDVDKVELPSETAAPESIEADDDLPF